MMSFLLSGKRRLSGFSQKIGEWVIQAGSARLNYLALPLLVRVAELLLADPSLNPFWVAPQPGGQVEFLQRALLLR
jgi:hypothetical protein